MTAIDQTLTPANSYHLYGYASLDAMKIDFERIRNKYPDLGAWNKNTPLNDYQKQRIMEKRKGSVSIKEEKQEDMGNIRQQQQAEQRQQQQQAEQQRQQQIEAKRQQQEEQQRQQQIEAKRQQQQEEQQRQQRLKEEHEQQQQRAKQLLEQQQKENEIRLRQQETDLKLQQQERLAKIEQQRIEAERLKRQQELDHLQAIEQQKVEAERLRTQRQKEIIDRQREQEEKLKKDEQDRQEAERLRREQELKNIKYFGLTDIINYLVIGFALIGFVIGLHAPGFILGLMLGLFQLLTIINAKKKHRKNAFGIGFCISIGITVIYGIFHNFTFVEMLSDPSVKMPDFFTVNGLSKFLSVSICIIDLAALFVSRYQALDDSKV